MQCRAARFVKSRYSRYSSVSDMLDELGWTPLSQRRQEARLILFYKIINGLAQVPFEGVLVEAYKGTRRKHNMKFRQIGHRKDRKLELIDDDGETVDDKIMLKAMIEKFWGDLWCYTI